jgi:hypothetical protein
MEEAKMLTIPHLEKVRSPLRVRIQSSSSAVTILCSKDILQIRSRYFKEIIDTNVDDDEIVLPEDDPEDASLLLLDIHNLSFAAPYVSGSNRGQELKWNKTWALLSVSSLSLFPSCPILF